MGRVIVLGSINVDLETKIDSYPNPGEKVVGESLQRYAGGKGANQAVAARARGVEVEMVGAVDPVDEAANDEPTCDLLTQRMQIHEKNAWMLRSMLGQ